MPIQAFNDEMDIQAAGRPDIQKLIKMGMLKPEDIDPETGQRRAPQAKYVLQKMRHKNPETGQYEIVELKVNMGHVENPDCPGWRMGLTPEKYWKMLEKQHYNHTYRGRKDTYAPELSEEEAQLFSDWLDTNIELLNEKDDDEVPVDPIVKKKRKASKKKKEEKKKEDAKKEGAEEKKKKPGRPKKVTNDEDE